MGVGGGAPVNTPERMTGVPLMATRPKPEASAHQIQTRRSPRGWAHVIQRAAKLCTRETKMKRVKQCLKQIFLISIFLGAVLGAHAQTTKPVPKDDVQFWDEHTTGDTDGRTTAGPARVI